MLPWTTVYYKWNRIVCIFNPLIGKAELTRYPRFIRTIPKSIVISFICQLLKCVVPQNTFYFNHVSYVCQLIIVGYLTIMNILIGRGRLPKGTLHRFRFYRQRKKRNMVNGIRACFTKTHRDYRSLPFDLVRNSMRHSTWLHNAIRANNTTIS